MMITSWTLSDMVARLGVLSRSERNGFSS
jgi:hypothetical protein